MSEMLTLLIMQNVHIGLMEKVNIVKCTSDKQVDEFFFFKSCRLSDKIRTGFMNRTAYILKLWIKF